MPEPHHSELALVMSGGGARAAYQVGLLRSLARHHPGLSFPIVTGVSAGAINAAYLAARSESLREKVEVLTELWSHLTTDQVFRVGTRSLAGNVLRMGFKLVSGGAISVPRSHAFVDTTPLRSLLERLLEVRDEASSGNEKAAAGQKGASPATMHAIPGPMQASSGPSGAGPGSKHAIPGIDENLRCGHLKAVAITTSSYTTGQTITWVQGRDIHQWERAHRKSESTSLTVSHVMASAALPLFFPAIEVAGQWYGDGGVRLTAPLSPAVHLGADKIIAISTRYARSRVEADRPAVDGYPPPAQILGVLLNAIFLDLFDSDALTMERVNRMIEDLPVDKRHGMRPVKLLVLRPSRDLGQLANEYEAELPHAFRFLTRGLGTRETRSNDMLSLVMFQPDYLARLIELGEKDAEARRVEIAAFLESPTASASSNERGAVGKP